MKPAIASREKILSRLRNRPLEIKPLPEVIHGEWIRFENPIEKLGEAVRFVGGSCEQYASITQVKERLFSFPEFQSAKKVLSLVKGIDSSVCLEHIDHPHDLEDIDFMIVQGEIAVAENGAVWVTDERLKHRVAYFINQHLVMIVRRNDILHNMHEAYARLELGKQQFGCFISGPSKTADIEQSLVIGAHGCRTMQLYIVDSMQTNNV